MLPISFLKLILLLGFGVVAAAQAPVPAQTTATDGVIQSGPFKGMIMVTLHEGSNDLHLEGDSTPDVIFRAWRENGNAHGFNLTTFYRHAHYPADRFSPAFDRWELVPFFDASAQAEKAEMDSFRDSMGADCVLGDIFFLGPAPGLDKPTMAVIATREFGETFISSMPVSFDFYVLKKSDFGVGRPTVFFDKLQTVKSTGTYCDVADAMNKEFGVGPRFQAR